MNYPQANRTWNPARKPPGLRGGPGPAPAPMGMPGMPAMPGMPPGPYAPAHNMQPSGAMPNFAPVGAHGPGAMAPPMNQMPAHLRHGPPMPIARKGLLNGPPGGMKAMPPNAMLRPPPHAAPVPQVSPTSNSFDVLQKRSSAMHVPTPEVVVERVGGQDHKPLFRATITWLPERYQRDGLGHSKMEAKRAAAAAMLTLLDLRDRRPANFPNGVYEDRTPQEGAGGSGGARSVGLLGRQPPLDATRPALNGFPQPQPQNTHPNWQSSAQANVGGTQQTPMAVQKQTPMSVQQQTSMAVQQTTPMAVQQQTPMVAQQQAPMYAQKQEPMVAQQPAPAQGDARLNGLLSMMSKNPQFMQQLNSVHPAGAAPKAGGGMTVPMSRPVPAKDSQPKLIQEAAPVNAVPLGVEESRNAHGVSAQAAVPAPANAGASTASAPPVGGAASGTEKVEKVPQPQVGSGVTQEKPSVKSSGVELTSPKAEGDGGAAVLNAAAAPPAAAASSATEALKTTTPEKKATVEAALPPKKKRMLNALAASAPPSGAEEPGTTPPVSNAGAGQPSHPFTDGGGFGEMPGIAIPRKRTRLTETSAAVAAQSPHPPVTQSQTPPQPTSVVTAVMFVHVDDARAMAATVGLAGTSAANSLDLQVRAFGPMRTVQTETDRTVPRWMNVTRVAVSPHSPNAVEISLAFAAGRDASLLEPSQGRISIVTTSAHYAPLAVPGLVDVVGPDELVRHLEALQRQ